jgi:hypothetical protein
MIMPTHALSRGDDGWLLRWVLVGFVAGALSVVIFHQGTAALLYGLELTKRAPFSLQPTQPFGVPQLLSIAFWGGIWGMVFAVLFSRLDGAKLIIASLVFGAIFPTLVAWFVVAPLKGQPAAGGFVPMAMLIGPIVNGAWGLGTGIGLALSGRRGRWR